MRPQSPIQVGFVQATVQLACLGLLLLVLCSISLYLALLFLAAILGLAAKIFLDEKRDRTRGWRVRIGHAHSITYAEFYQGRWWCVLLSCKMSAENKRHFLVTLPSADALAEGPQPALANNRREEIIARIKSKLAAPRYTCEGE